ncbi:hypothetical protein V3C99_017914, partial [Haemonchus contortus]
RLLSQATVRQLLCCTTRGYITSGWHQQRGSLGLIPLLHQLLLSQSRLLGVGW